MKNRTKICLLYDFSCSDMINCSKSEQIKHHLCSKLWVRPCGATEGFGRVHFMNGGGCLKHKLGISAPFCLLPLFENQKLLHHPRNKTTNTHTEEMHRKPEVSLFSIIAILTINCVINAIQQLCKQAVSDVVSYLQYEDNKNDAFGFFLLLLFFPPSWVWFFQASSHCLNHSRPIYTVTGFTAGGELVCRFPVSYQSQRNLIS